MYVSLVKKFKKTGIVEILKPKIKKKEISLLKKT